MTKIKLQDLIRILSSDVIKYGCCIEMNFCINNDNEYKECWLGKMPDRDDPSKEVYWYGLVPDGSQAYDYSRLEDIINAEVFHGKCMSYVIKGITWYSLDGCSIEERLSHYLKEEGFSKFTSRNEDLKSC